MKERVDDDDASIAKVIVHRYPMSTSKSTPEQLEELVRLIAKTPARRRYVLLRRASGELAFVQEELDAMLEQAIAAAFGEPKPRRRVIKIDPPSRKACS